MARNDGKRSFVMYQSWHPAIRKMTNEQAGIFIKAVYAFKDSGDIGISTGEQTVDCLLEIVKATMAEDAEKYANVCQRRRDAATERWSKSSSNGLKNIQMDANASKRRQMDYDTESDSESESVSESDSESDSSREHINKKRVCRTNKFVHPTLEQVREYCNERGNSIDPQRFIDYYESNGWKVGKNPMKDWKAAVRTWEQREAAPKKADNEAEIRQYYQQAKQLYPTDTGKDEGWETFRKKSKGDPKIARRIANCIGEMAEQYYSGTVGLNGLDKDIEVAYEHIRG